jgi:IclR family transcriptional regulator, KDG regulon repressor
MQRGIMVRRDKSNYIIQAVAHALDVLEQFFSREGELGVTELSKRLKLHKNNVFRILATLESHEYIEQNRATENYRLGTKCLQLGQTYIQHTGILQQAKPIVEDLVKECRESAYVAVMRKGKVVPIDMVEADQPVRIISYVGENLPLHCTASGKIHLAFEPPEEVQRCLSNTLEKRTAYTIIDRQVLLEQLKEITSRGYAVENGEYCAYSCRPSKRLHARSRWQLSDQWSILSHSTGTCRARDYPRAGQSRQRTLQPLGL